MTKRHVRVFEAAVLGVCACINLAFAGWVVKARPALNIDFMGIWSAAKFAQQHAAMLYQAAPLQAFQQQIFPGFQSFYPFQYPPVFLLFIGWLGDLPYATAVAVWTLAGLIALGLAAALFFKPGLRGVAFLALAASPAALLNGVAGETGYFTTALLLAGFALLPARPALAGIAFGLLTFKPQLAILIPVALLARTDFRALAFACLTALTLAAVSCAMLPPRLWLDWVHCLPGYQTQYLAGGTTDLNTVVTIAGNLIVAGVPPGLAWGLQAVAGSAVILAVFLAFRRAPYHLALAALFAGMFLCTPHAYAYDTIPLTAALLLLAPESPVCIGFGVLIYLAPYLLLTRFSSWFYYAIPETLLFAGIIYLAIIAEPRPNMTHESVPAAKPIPDQF